MRRRFVHAIMLLIPVGLILWGCAGQETGLSVGDQAPDFTLPAAQGEPVSLADYRGNQPVLLYFHMALG